MSRSEQKARNYAERHNIRKWYTDAQELIEDPDINAIYIATPPSSHATFAIMAMRAGKPVYVEKPLAASYDDCVRINRISEQTGVPCYVAYYRRYLPYFQRVKEIIREGRIGNITNVQVRTITPPANCHGACSQTSLVVVISTTWPLINLIYCKTSLALSSKPTVIAPTAPTSIPQKIP